MSTAHAIEDNARSQAYHARVNREWGEEAGEQARAALVRFLDELYYTAADTASIRDSIMDALCDHEPSGTMDTDAYFAALKGGA